MAEQFSNQSIVNALLPLSSEIIKRQLEKHVRLSDNDYIKKCAYTYLDEAHQKAFANEFVAPFKALVKEIYPKYLEALYAAFDTIEVKIEGEDATKERDERCKEVSLWLARYIAENPAHAEDEPFLDILARELAGKFLAGLPRLDLEVVLDIITGSLQGHMDTVFKAKFGKAPNEVDLDDIQEVLTQVKPQAKSAPEEK